MNRPNEITEAINCLNDFAYNELYMEIESWETIYEYIEQLEETVQDLSAELARTYDDCK